MHWADAVSVVPQGHGQRVNQQDEEWKGPRTIRCSVRNDKDSRRSRS